MNIHVQVQLKLQKYGEDICCFLVSLIIQVFLRNEQFLRDIQRFKAEIKAIAFYVILFIIFLNTNLIKKNCYKKLSFNKIYQILKIIMFHGVAIISCGFFTFWGGSTLWATSNKWCKSILNFLEFLIINFFLFTWIIIEPFKAFCI